MNLATFHYVSLPMRGKEVLLNKVWETRKTLQFRTIRATVLSVGPKRLRVKTKGHKTYTLFRNETHPSLSYENPDRTVNMRDIFDWTLADHYPPQSHEK